MAFRISIPLALACLLPFCALGLSGQDVSTADPAQAIAAASPTGYEVKEEPLPPPQLGKYYRERYGALSVPAVLQGTEEVMIEGWTENLRGVEVLRGITLQGAIKYRRAKVFEVEPKPSIGYRIEGHGRVDPFDKNIVLNLGESYIFKMKSKEQQAYPMLVHKPDPIQPYKFFPYNGFELMNNERDLASLRFTPMPDTPDNLELGNRQFRQTLKGNFTINRQPQPSNDGVIHLTVLIRREIVEQYIELLEDGHIKQPISLGADTIEFYNEIVKGFNEGEAWLGGLGQYDRPGHRVIMVRTDPTPILAGFQYSPAFPRPVILEKRQIHTMNSSQPVSSSKFLVQFKSSAQGDKFVKKLLQEETKYNPAIGRTLRDTSLITESLQIASAMGLVEVNERKALDAFRKKRQAFDSRLNSFKSLNITYAVNDEALGEAQTLIFNEDYIRGLHKLRPHTYPLIKLAPIPKYFGNTRISYFQDHVEYLLQSLLDGARSDKVPENYQTSFMYEAFGIIYMLPLYEMDNKEFIRKALDLVALLARTGSPTDAARANYLLNLIPFDKEDEESVAAFFKVAENFRSGGIFSKALEIYEQFFPMTGSPYYKEACLWSAFCRASSTPPQFGAANLSLEKFLKTYGNNQPPRDDQFYSLWRLVEAILHYNQYLKYHKDQQQTDIPESARLAARTLAKENIDISMDRVSEAVVYSRVGYSWLPEALALSAQCYARLERQATASKVYQELKVFYPKHPKTKQFEIDFPDIVGN